MIYRQGIWALFLIWLAGCSNNTAPDNIAISPSSHHAWQRHQETLVPLYFLITEDGQGSLSIRSKSLDCQPVESIDFWRQECAQETGRVCKLAGTRGVASAAFEMIPDLPDKHMQAYTTARCIGDNVPTPVDHYRSYQHLIP